MEIFIRQYCYLLLIMLASLSFIASYSVMLVALFALKRSKKISSIRKISELITTVMLAATTTIFMGPLLKREFKNLLTPTSEYIFERGQYKIDIRGNPNQIQIDEISKAFSNMNGGIANTIQEIALREYEHFSGSWEIAHVSCGKGVICIRNTEFLSHSTVEHEAAHLYTWIAGIKFVKEWKAAADQNIYGFAIKNTTFGPVWKDGSHSIMKYGLIEPYGAKNVYEDIATFYVYVCDLLVSKNEQDFLALKSACAKDKRYELKISLLYKNGFITKEQYQKILDHIKK